MLIGITGPAGAGKDTVADHLVAEHGFHKLSWAGPLKAALASMGLSEPADRELKEQLVPGFNFTWRRAAQTLGTEWGRGLDPDIWIKLVGQTITRNPEVDWVISDCRFENEAALIRKLGGEVWHLSGRSADLGIAAGHVSEAGIAQTLADEAIYNSYTLEYLYRHIDYMVMRRQNGGWSK